MTERTAALIEAELNAAINMADQWRAKVVALRRELDAAKVAESSNHPWVGRKVFAMRRASTWGERAQTLLRKEGTVEVFDPRKHNSIRGLYAKAGELIVLSPSGKSAFNLNDRGKLALIETPWALIEENDK